MFSFFSRFKKPNPCQQAVNEVLEKIKQILYTLAPYKFTVVKCIEADPIANNYEPYFWSYEDTTYLNLLKSCEHVRTLEDVFNSFKLLIKSVELFDRERKCYLYRLAEFQSAGAEGIDDYNHFTQLLSQYDQQCAAIKPYLTELKKLIVDYGTLLLQETYGLLPEPIASKLLFSYNAVNNNEVLSLEDSCILKLKENLDLEQLHRDMLEGKMQKKYGRYFY